MDGICESPQNLGILGSSGPFRREIHSVWEILWDSVGTKRLHGCAKFEVHLYVQMEFVPSLRDSGFPCLFGWNLCQGCKIP